MRLYLWAGLVVIAACAGAVYFLTHFDPCDTSVEQIIPSPGGDRILVVFHRDCGATTDFNTQISVAPAGQKFSFDDDPPFFGVTGQYALDARWLSATRIHVAVPVSGKVFRKRALIGDIAIDYR